MSEYIDKFLKYLKIEKNYSINTIESYKKDLLEFNEYLKNKKIKDVDYKFIRDYLAYMYQKKYMSCECMS